MTPTTRRALFRLSITTGVLMILAGVLRLGSLLRFVSNAVMVGFVNAVGVNIVLGQLADFTGYDGQGGSRVIRAVDTLLHPGRLDARTVLIGAATIALIITLERTRLGHSSSPSSTPLSWASGCRSSFK